MKNYLFKISAAMKPYNANRYWIDPNIIKKLTIEANDLDEALELFRQTINCNCNISVSKNALKTKQPMFRDDEFADFSHR